MNQGNKGLLYGMGGWTQLFFFFFLAFTGLITTIFILTLSGFSVEYTESVRSVRFILTVQTICFFIVPSLLFAFLCQSNTKEYLKVDDPYNISLLIAAVCLIFAVQPVIDFVGYYNREMVLPESLSAIEYWMKENELAAKATTDLLFSDKTIWGLTLNLLIIAVAAGLAEELFFRGCLQQIIQKIVTNQHVAVWITAIIFSAIHFQFYGFVPRMLLGALLGYLFIWSGSIWLPVIIHTINNTLGVVVAFLFYGTPEYSELSVYNINENIWVTIISLIITCALILFIYKRRILISKI